MKHCLSLVLACAASAAVAQQVASAPVQDPLYAGPQLEAVHYYYDLWPTGMRLVSRSLKQH